MSIRDFHSKLSSRSEDNPLFEALRRLRRLEDFRDIFAEEEVGGGWYPWSDVTGYPPAAAAEA